MKTQMKNTKKYFVSSPPKNKKQRLILVFGSFDIVHPAHLKFLEEARKAVKCSNCKLVLIIARDSSIIRIKGHKPIFNEEDRLKLICGLRIVDYACLGNEGSDQFKIISEFKPDFIVLGYDQLPNDKPLYKFITDNKLQTKIFRLPKYESGDLSSSSKIREKVLEIYNQKKEGIPEK